MNLIFQKDEELRSNRYAVPNPSTGEKRILMCRVILVEVVEEM